MPNTLNRKAVRVIDRDQLSWMHLVFFRSKVLVYAEFRMSMSERDYQQIPNGSMKKG